MWRGRPAELATLTHLDVKPPRIPATSKAKRTTDKAALCFRQDTGVFTRVLTGILADAYPRVATSDGLLEPED